MRNPITRFVSLALFAQLLVVISSAQRNHSSSHKLRNLHRHEVEPEVHSPLDLEKPKEEEVPTINIRLTIEGNSEEDPEEDDDIPIVNIPEEEENDKPIINTPEIEEPEIEEPEIEEPEIEEPEIEEPQIEEPEIDEPEIDEPEIDEPENPIIDNPENKDKPSCSGDACLCKDYFDVALVVETSSFSGNENWIETYKPFILNLASKFIIASDRVHMALLFFASRNEEFIKFSDPESQDEEKFMEKVDSLTVNDIGKSHNVLYVDALFHALERMLFGNGTRDNVPKASILFTYGYDNDTNRAFIPDVVEAYKDEGVKLIAVGMEMDGNENIYSLGGCENNDKDCPTAMVVETEYLNSAARGIKNKLCKSGKQ